MVGGNRDVTSNGRSLASDTETSTTPPRAKLAVWLFRVMVFFSASSLLWRLRQLITLPPGQRQPYFGAVLVPRLAYLLLYAGTLFVIRRWPVAGAALGTAVLGHHAFLSASATSRAFGQHATLLAPGVLALGGLSLLLVVAAVLLAWQGVSRGATRSVGAEG
jgi:hypothetical protein